VLKSIPPDGQKRVCHHIGVLNCTTYTEPDMHYLLRLYRPDEFEKARRLANLSRLVNAGLRRSDVPNMRRMKLNGDPIKLEENHRLFENITGHADVAKGDIPQNVIEFDFVSNLEQLQAAAAVQIQARWRANLAVKNRAVSVMFIRLIQAKWKLKFEARRVVRLQQETELREKVERAKEQLRKMRMSSKSYLMAMSFNDK